MPSQRNMKLAINYNVISAIEVISETYLFAEKCGLPLEHLRDFYQQLWFAHPAPQLYAEKIRKRDFAGRGGFVMEQPDLPALLQQAQANGFPVDPANATYFIGHVTIVPREDGKGLPRLVLATIAFLRRNSVEAIEYFRLPRDMVVEIGRQFAI